MNDSVYIMAKALLSLGRQEECRVVIILERSSGESDCMSNIQDPARLLQKALEIVRTVEGRSELPIEQMNAH